MKLIFVRTRYSCTAITFCISHETKLMCYYWESHFSWKEVSCKICSCSVSLLGRHAIKYIENEPLITFGSPNPLIANGRGWFPLCKLGFPLLGCVGIFTLLDFHLSRGVLWAELCQIILLSVTSFSLGCLISLFSDFSTSVNT